MTWLKAIPLLLLALISCEPVNTQQVVATVTVLDEATGQPIPHAHMVVAGIYDRPGLGTANGDSIVYGSTSTRGLFQTRFPLAFTVAAAAQAPGYLPARTLTSVRQTQLQLTLYLRHSHTNPTLRSHLYYNLLATAMPELRHLPGGDSLEVGKPLELSVNYCPQSSGLAIQDSYGLLLARGQISRDTAHCDIWLAPAATARRPTVLVAGGQGGIYPIMLASYPQSLHFGFAQAPERSYQQRYTLTGNEAGFFVRTRDGQHYGKYILSAGAGFNASATSVEGPMCRYWWQGSCLYQSTGSHDLTLDIASVNLLYFLRGSIR